MRFCVLALLCACGSHHAAPSVAQDPPVATSKLPVGPPYATPGEHMSYRLALRGVDLATYDLGIGEVQEIAGKQAIVVQSHAKAIGLAKVLANVDDFFTSWIDVATGRPLLWTVDEYAVKGEDKEKSEARFYERDGDIFPLDFHINNETPKPEPQKVSMPDTWDKNSFLIALRGWDVPPGSTVTLEVLRSRFLWNIKMTMSKKERLVTEIGEFPAFRINGHAYKLKKDGARDPESDERDFTVWVGADDARVPLKLVARTDYGDIQMKIVDWQPGNGKRLHP